MYRGKPIAIGYFRIGSQKLLDILSANSDFQLDLIQIVHFLNARTSYTLHAH